MKKNMTMKTAADMSNRIEIRKDAEAGMYEVYNVATGEVYTREQSDYEARVWRARRFSGPSKTLYCPSCLTEDLFVTECRRHA